MNARVDSPPAGGARAARTFLASGQLIGWVCVAMVDAIAMALGARHRTAPLGVRALHYGYDFALALAAGLVTSAALSAWSRWGSRRRSVGLGALALTSLAIGAGVLPDDLGNVAGSLPLPRVLATGILVALVASSAPLAAAFALRVSERAETSGSKRARAALVVAGLGLAAVNHLALENDYEGLHFYAAWIAAITLGCAIGDGGEPEAAPPRSRLRRGMDVALAVALVTLALGALALEPSSALSFDLLRANGGRLAPWVLHARRFFRGRSVDMLPRAWVVDRSRLAPLPPSSPPLLPAGAIVVLVTVDALRADVVAAPENARRFPTLAALRRESVVFDDARSVAPGTSASVASIFTGKYFSQLHWTPLTGSPLVCPHDDDSPRFTEILADLGVQTVTFTSMPGLLNATGIARGWKEETFVPGSPWATAPMVTEPLLARLRRQGPEPLFLYVHYTDAHAPYGAPAVKGDEHERYMFQVGVIDGQIGRIRKAIADAGLDARATLILSADHGEAFGEHDQHYHATTVYEELLRVPLMVRLPGAAPAVVTDPVSLIDLGPTLLDLMGARTPASFMGQSLVPYLRGGRARLTRPLVAESSRGKLAMITGTVKVIDDVRVGTCEVYDLAADKAEAVNLIDKPAYAGAARCAQLESFRAEHELHRPGYVTPFVR